MVKVTALSSGLSAGCGRSPGWASVAGTHPGCRKHCWTPVKREALYNYKYLNVLAQFIVYRDINARRIDALSWISACGFKIRRLQVEAALSVL